ncbi:helix-turn-helix domain-containing protein [Gemella sp. 19428wG2_WT2a]|nr:helix-turn-helix domain-containing protein [Gemella sp. 19428wG2_WT2a]TFU59960.1 helix-turn-helix domain-containing protein [Gemella sp. WT2a]
MLGKTLRYFRKSKNLALEYVCQDILTVSFLSKVERGLSDISANNLLLVLKKLGIDLYEFAHIYSLFQESEDLDFIKLHNLYSNKEISSIKNILENNKNKSYYNNKKIDKILLQILISKLETTTVNKKDIKYVHSYLMTLNSWTYRDLYLYCQSLHLYDHNIMINLSNIALKTCNKYYDNINYTFSIIYMLLNNTILQCLKFNDIENAEYFLNSLLNKKINNRDYYHKLKTRSLEILVSYKKGMTPLSELKVLLDTLTFIDSSEHSYKQTKLLLKDILPDNDFTKLFK